MTPSEIGRGQGLSLGAWLAGPWPLALIVTLVGAAIGVIALHPQVGIDDANITHVYADNLAKGFGYVYRAGGERVEGSTSLLWTLINVPFFAISSNPEGLLAAVCFLLTVATVALALKLTDQLAAIWGLDGPWPRIVSAASFAIFPAFFAWSIWSLMDLTHWVLMLTLLAWVSMRMIGSLAGSPALSRIEQGLFLVGCLLLPLTRPEGAAIAAGLGAALSAYMFVRGDKRLAMLCGAGATLAIAATIAVTLWRISYFGFPFPNTFYAKVSTGLIPQAIEGVKYVIRFLLGDLTSVVAAPCLAFAAYQLINPAKTRAQGLKRDAALFAIVFIAGLAAIYAVLGGDHFAYSRFMQPAVPLMCAMVGVVVMLAWRALPAAARTWRVAAASGLAMLTIFGEAVFRFLVDSGEFALQFRIAEEGRRTGETFRALPSGWRVGVITAGGFARTFQGPIHDLLGLNWVEMAHAVDDMTGSYRGHGSFDLATLLKHKPEVLYIDIRSCRPSIQWPEPYANEDYFRGALDHPDFKAAYVHACMFGYNFMVLRPLLEARPDVLTAPPTGLEGRR